MRFFLLPLFLVGLSLSFLRAESYGPISVQEVQLAENRSDETVHGYIEYRFRVSNKDSRPHHVGLRMSNDRGFSGPALIRSTNEATVPPETSVTISLFQPVVNMSSSGGVAVLINGRLQRNETRFVPVASHISAYSRRSHETANVFVSQQVPADMRDLIRTGAPAAASTPPPTPPPGAVMPGLGGAGTMAIGMPVMREVICWLANAPVGEWSENWLAYTRFDGVILTSGEWGDLQSQFPDVVTALRKYTEAGGALCIVGMDWTAPKEWTPIPTEGIYNAVFGDVRVIAGTTAEATPQIGPLRDLFIEKVKPWESALERSTRHYGGSYTTSTGSMTGGDVTLTNLPVVESYGVPVKLIMVLIVVFAVLIGPVNIYVLSLFKRRIWLLWTVPVTSLAASFLVLGINFVQEGSLRQSSSKTTTVLNQRTEEATTIGYIGFYATLMPRSGVVFDTDTEATGCFNRSYGENRALELDIVGGGSQHFSRGWINARVPAYFAIRKAQSHRKERIVFDWDASPPTATNGLGVDIKSLRVCSPSGESFKIVNMKAGQQSPLVAETSGEPSDAGPELRRLLQLKIQNGPSPRLSLPTLPRSSYLAEIDAWNPFVEPGIERMKPYQNATTVYGIF